MRLRLEVLLIFFVVCLCDGVWCRTDGEPRLKRLSHLDIPKKVEVDKVKRHIVAKNNVVTSTLRATIRNDEPNEISVFYLAFPATKKIGFVEVSSDTAGKLKSEDVEVLIHEDDARADDFQSADEIRSDTFRHVKVWFPEPLLPKKSFDFTVVVYAGHCFQPYPKSIELQESQKVIYQEDQLVTFPYPVHQQSTSIDLKQISRIEPANVAADIAKNTAKLVDINDTKPPYSRGDAIKVYGVLDRHLGYFSSVLNYIEVSHWGNVKIHEEYEFRNDAAKLKGEFSQAEVSNILGRVTGPITRNAPPQSAVAWEFDANFPQSAYGIEYYDLIGNISSSAAFRKRSGISVTLTPRYPILGQWNGDWMIDYALPIDQVLSVKGQRHFLDLNFGPAVQGMFIDRLSVDVALPQGAKRIRVRTPQTVSSKWETTRQSWFDILSGRPVAAFRANDLFVPMKDSAKYSFQVSYDYVHSISDSRKPLLICGLVFIPFLIFIGMGRLSLRIGSAEEKAQAETRSLHKSIAAHVSQCCESIFLKNDLFCNSIDNGEKAATAYNSWKYDVTPICEGVDQHLSVLKEESESGSLTALPNLLKDLESAISRYCSRSSEERDVKNGTALKQLREEIQVFETEMLETIRKSTFDRQEHVSKKDI